MDLTKILSKKELEASGSDDKIENYSKEHKDDLVDFKGYTIPYHECEALKEIMQKYKLEIKYIGFDDEHVTSLDLGFEGIKSISEIPKLENLTNLRKLKLWKNEITEIKGVETLTNLQILDLRKNEITEIEGLENLTNLKKLDLEWNKLSSSSESVIKSLKERGVSVWT